MRHSSKISNGVKKNPNKKTVAKAEEAKLQAIIAELSEISQKREKEIQELDHVAKMLVRRDLALTEMKEEQVKELQEMDRIAKVLVRRDFELSEIQEKREKELKELKESRAALMNILEDVEKSRVALMNILEDVEEARKRAEEERDKTQAIIINFSDGLLLFDVENKLSLINPQAEKLFGVEEKNIIGKSIPDLSGLSIFKPLTDLVGKEIEGIFRKETEIKENLVLEVTTVPITREKEKLGTLIILHDVTREKLVERIKTEFVSLAAHQLRTPLSAIKWTLKMLLDGDLGKITKEQKKFIEKSYQSNERMIDLINDLLDVTRIEEGRYLTRLVLADFEKVVHFVINSYQEEIARKKIVLDFKKPETKLPRIAMDVEKMRLVIQNLLDNAVRYSFSGGKIVILLKYDKDKKEIMFVIKDSGVGVPHDQQTRVFTKFFRGANVIRIETEGSGLGLFISKNIIEAHGGKIWFESEERKGATFYFTIPIKKKSGES